MAGPHADENEAQWRAAFLALSPKERKKRVAGTKQAINDLLSQSRYFSPAVRTEIDRRLERKNLPPLRKLELGLKRVHLRILKRGRIRNEEEYYIVQEILADQEFDVTDDDRARLEWMAGEFGQRLGPKG